MATLLIEVVIVLALLLTTLFDSTDLTNLAQSSGTLSFDDVREFKETGVAAKVLVICSSLLLLFSALLLAAALVGC